MRRTDKLTAGAIAIATALAVAAASAESAPQDSRTSPQQQQQQQQQSARLQKGALPTLHHNITCGTKNDLISRVDVCVSPLMGILQGTIKRWPRDNSDARALCDDFGGAEKCIRENARKCAKGIHKTIISTLANSVQRVRRRECSDNNLANIVKTTTCIERNLAQVKSVIANITSRLSAIETNLPDPDRKVNAICCVANSVEGELDQLFTRLKCPAEGKFVLRLYRSVLEDVIELICRQPKCNNLFGGQKIRYRDDFGGMIPIILRIVFSLG